MPPTSLSLLLRPSLTRQELHAFGFRHIHCLNIQQPCLAAHRVQSSNNIPFSNPPQNRRRFHQTPWRQRGRRWKDEQSEDTSLNPSQMLLEQQAKQDDLGIFPGTAIVITRKDWPLWLKAPKARLKMEWQYVKVQVMDLAARTSAKGSKGWRHFNKISLSRREAMQSALWLHESFYAAVARGDLETLRELTTSGLYSKMKEMIRKRPAGETYTWERQQSQPSVNVITNRVTLMPRLDEDTAPSKNVWLRQAIVRIRSEQHLRKNPPESGEHRAGTKVQSGFYDELFVIQKKMGDGSENEEWKVWGTTEEVKAKDWDTTINPPMPDTSNIQSPAS